jgi:hypothetical protein
MYKGNFENKNDVVENFTDGYDGTEPDLKGAKILLAWYGYGDYDGSAFVLFERDGKLYEVNGGHCSCYGLEGQWDPEETSVEALRYRIVEGELGKSSYYDEGMFDVALKKILTRWERKQAS